jgi:hypothetical protein
LRHDRYPRQPTLGFLSPVDGSKLRVTGIASVAEVLGVEAGDIVDENARRPCRRRPEAPEWLV